MKLPQVGSNPPQEVNVVIEISAGSAPVKYEYDKETHMLFVDRFLCTSMLYPCNYGFIPHTLSGDSDPLDVLVYSSQPIISGAVIVVRPIGLLMTEDEKGKDIKLVAVPLKQVDPFLAKIHDIDDLPDMLKKQIEHFFERYKDLEEGKWVKIQNWDNKERAQLAIMECVKRYNDELSKS